MPERALKICRRHGSFSGRRCMACQRDRFANLTAHQPVRLGPARYAVSAWREASDAFLILHPYCQARVHTDPITTPPATVVDHIDGTGVDGPRGYDETNWQALCKPCHSAKTNRHDGGVGNKRTPPDDPRRDLR